MVFSFDVLLSRLQEAKVLKKMRIEDISKKSNVPVGTISKIFAGITTDPKIGTLIAIADALDANIDYLIYGKKRNQYRYYIFRKRVYYNKKISPTYCGAARGDRK